MMCAVVVLVVRLFAGGVEKNVWVSGERVKEVESEVARNETSPHSVMKMDFGSFQSIS